MKKPVVKKTPVIVGGRKIDLDSLIGELKTVRNNAGENLPVFVSIAIGAIAVASAEKEATR